MSDVLGQVPVQSPVQVIVAAFKESDSASNVLAELKQAKRDGLIDIEDAAVITKDADGKSKIRETQDLGTGRGATIGAITGAVLSLIAGPLGWMALGGGVIGAIAAMMIEGGFPQDRLTHLAEGLAPGSSALVVIVEHNWVDQLVDEIEKHDANILKVDLPAEISQELAAGNDALYTVATTGDAVFVSSTSGKSNGLKDQLVLHDNSYANNP